MYTKNTRFISFYVLEEREREREREREKERERIKYNISSLTEENIETIILYYLNIFNKICTFLVACCPFIENSLNFV